MNGYWAEWAQKVDTNEDNKLILLAAIADALEDLVETKKK